MSGAHALSHARYVLINRLAPPVGAFVILIIIGRHSDELLGQYALVMTFYYIMQMLPLLGLTSYVMREVARTPDRAGRYFASIGFLSLLGCVVVNLACFGLLKLVDYPAAVDAGIAVTGILIFPGILLFIAEIIFMSLHRARPVAIVAVAENLIRVLLSLAALRAGGGIAALIWVFLATRLGALIVYLYIMKRAGIVSGFERPDPRILRETVRVLPGFLIGTLLFVVFSRMDFLALSLYEQIEVIGHYAIAYRPFEIGLVVLTAIIMAVFPWISRKFKGAKLQFRVAVKDMILLLAAGLSFVSFCGVLLGQYYVQLFFALQYPQPVLLTQLFMAAFFICGMDFVASGILHASDRQAWDTKAAALGGAVNIALLIGLVPVFGIYGAFAAKVGSTAVQSVFKFVWVGQATGVRWRGRELAALTGAFVVMAALTWLLADAGAGWKLLGILFAAIFLPVSFLATSLLRPLRMLRFYWRPRRRTNVASGSAELIDTAIGEIRRGRRDALDRATVALLLHRTARFLHLRQRPGCAALLSRASIWLTAVPIDPASPDGPPLPRLSPTLARGAEK